MKLFRRKKKNKPLNFAVLNKYRSEAMSRLRFWGIWSGYWETTIDNVRYRSEIVESIDYLANVIGGIFKKKAVKWPLSFYIR